MIKNKNKNKQIADHPKKLYFTHDNGSKPFAVAIYPSRVDVFDNAKNDLYLIGKIRIKSKSLVMLGNDINTPTNDTNLGNSLIIQISKNNYIFIGHDIRKFSTNEKILKYFSPIGNNDVPYPYAVTEHFTYLLTENVYIDNKYLQSFTATNPYAYYYGLDVGKNRTDGIKPFKSKIIVKRTI